MITMQLSVSFVSGFLSTHQQHGSLLSRLPAGQPLLYLLHSEDSQTANCASGRESQAVYIDLASAAESGWDFSSRWLADDTALHTIRTIRVGS